MSALRFLSASHLDVAKCQAHADVAVDLARIEAMCRLGKDVEAYWYAHHRAHGYAIELARAARGRYGAYYLRANERVLRTYLITRATIAGGRKMDRVKAGDHLRPAFPCRQSQHSPWFSLEKPMTNPWWPELGSIEGVRADVVCYQNSQFMLSFHVGFPNRYRTQWSRRSVFSTIEEATQEGTAL